MNFRSKLKLTAHNKIALEILFLFQLENDQSDPVNCAYQPSKNVDSHSVALRFQFQAGNVEEAHTPPLAHTNQTCVSNFK